MPMTDGRNIMLAVASDKPGAFDLLVKTFGTRIKAQIRRHVSDRAVVDDLAQEVLLRLYRSRARYKPTARFETYLYRIILNLCVNYTQYSRRRRTVSLDHGDDTRPGERVSLVDDGAHSPEDLAIVAERGAMVREAVHGLPLAQRRVMLLSRFDGLANEEVATHVGTSAEAVKSMLWRARANVRTRLRPALGLDCAF